MSLENYIVFVAPDGSEVHGHAHDIMRERKANAEARMVFSRSITGGLGLWAGESRVSGVLFAPGKVPSGWRKKEPGEGHWICVPDLKTKAGKLHRDELKALPPLVGAEEFTTRIGTSFMVIDRCLRYCWFEELDGELFVMVPKVLTAGKADWELHQKQFEPKGCNRVALSRYYAAKENQDAALSKDKTA